MRMATEWLKTLICLSFLFAWTTLASRPRFDVSTDMGMVLVPADAEVDSVIFRLRATDQDADFPLIFEIIATTSPIVRAENLPCTLYNKVCQANVILTRRLVPGRLHDFVVRVKDSRGDVNSMQATISVTNSTTSRDRIFPHVPTIIMVPEDTKPEKELDYLLVQSNPWSGKPVYIELWQPKELFKIRQRQVGTQTKGIITLIGELDFETQSMYTLKMYATDPYTQPGKDTRNIAGCHVVVVVQDVQDVPPVFTVAPPLTKINNTMQPGDLILRVHAEDGDKGVPRAVTYGLISEGNPFTPFFNVSETTGEIMLARPLEELTKITHVGAPIILKIVAEEIRTSRDEPPAQASVVELGLLLGEPGNSPPYFESDSYVAWINENPEPGTIVTFTDAYVTKVKDEDIGKAGVFALKLENNNGTFEVSPAVAERSTNFMIIVRDNSLVDYEKFKSLKCMLIAQEVGPATHLSTSVLVTIFIRDINDNHPVFDTPIYEVTLPENSNPGTRVVVVHATDLDSGPFGRIQYVNIVGDGSSAFQMNSETGMITVSMHSNLDREMTARLDLMVEARDENGRGLRGTALLIINILDVNDKTPIFEKSNYEFMLNGELTNFTVPAFVKAVDDDAEAPNNVVRYEIVHGNYDNKFQINQESGELKVQGVISRVRKTRSVSRNEFVTSEPETSNIRSNQSVFSNSTWLSQETYSFNSESSEANFENKNRSRRADSNVLFILTVRAYDLGVPHLSSTIQIRILRPSTAFARIVMFVMPGENPDPNKTAETLATITGSRVIIQEIKPYATQTDPNSSNTEKRSVVVAKVEQNGRGTLVDLNKIRQSLEKNGFGIISGMDNMDDGSGENGDTNYNTHSEEVTVYKAENKFLTWLLILLGLLVLASVITAIICCVCSSCPFYMEPRKRKIHSAETLVIRPNGRPKRHLHRKPIKMIDERKEAWSADPESQQWQFNQRNTKNLGIASLPGDVIVPRNQKLDAEPNRAASLRNGYLPPAGLGEPINRQVLYPEELEMDSIRRHELERGSDRVHKDLEDMSSNREQHFFKDGNAEVMRLVTRGEIEEHSDFYHNGKDILMQRFIEDQKVRQGQVLRDSYHDSIHNGDAVSSMVSHKRAKEPTEILLLPERLEMQQHPSYNQNHKSGKPSNADIQRLIVNHSNRMKVNNGDEYMMQNMSTLFKEMEFPIPDASKAGYPRHESEICRQNALLTRLLLEKEGKSTDIPVVDHSNFLETQSLPGQIATATQTDRTAATQTESNYRSRSDNEDLDNELQCRVDPQTTGQFESKENYKHTKKIWVQTPILEECQMQNDHKKSVHSNTKIDVLESRKVSAPTILSKEMSNTLITTESDPTWYVKNSISKHHTENFSIIEQKEPSMKPRTFSNNSKKLKESNDDKSTTPSPEKKKDMLLKNKVRKKPIKPPRKRLEQKMEVEKCNFIEPSFRVLERELNIFQQKIRQFGDDKLQMIKKKDCKTDRESGNDSGTTYDITKKSLCNIASISRSTSKDSSPIKISVKEKKTSDDPDNEDKILKQRHVHNFSSTDSNELENQRSVELVTRFEMESRTQSKIRRQFNVDESDKVSNSEGILKSDELKTDSKDSSSSRESKRNSNISGNERNKKFELNDKRISQNLKSIPKVKPTYTNVKPLQFSVKASPKDSSVKSKDNIKLSSPKINENTSYKKSNSSMNERSVANIDRMTENSVSLNSNNLSNEFREKVEKEVTSLIEAAKEAVLSKISQSNYNEDNKMIEKSNNSINEKGSIKKSIVNSNLASQSNTDDAISFIVIEKNRTASHIADYSKKLDIPSKAPEKIAKTKDMPTINRDTNEKCIDLKNSQVAIEINKPEKLDNEIVNSRSQEKKESIANQQGNELNKESFDSMKTSVAKLNVDEKLNTNEENHKLKFSDDDVADKNSNFKGKDYTENLHSDKERSKIPTPKMTETEITENKVSVVNNILDSISDNGVTMASTNNERVNENEDVNQSIHKKNSKSEVKKELDLAEKLASDIVDSTLIKVQKIPCKSNELTTYLSMPYEGTCNQYAMNSETVVDPSNLKSNTDSISSINVVEDGRCNYEKNSSKPNDILQEKKLENDPKNSDEVLNMSDSSQTKKVMSVKLTEHVLEQTSSGQEIAFLSNTRNFEESLEITSLEKSSSEKNSTPQTADNVSENQSSKLPKEVNVDISLQAKNSFDNPPQYMNYPPPPLFSITDVTCIIEDEDDSENDSSFASDISNKTALQTQPYRTPRHSTSSDAVENVDENKIRRRWSLDKEEIELQQESLFSQKMEIFSAEDSATSMDKMINSDMMKSPMKKMHTNPQKSAAFTEIRTPKILNAKKYDESNRLVVAAAKSKDYTYKRNNYNTTSPEKTVSNKKLGEQQYKKDGAEIQSKHLKLHVSHPGRQSRVKTVNSRKVSNLSPMHDNKKGDKNSVVPNSRSRYMAWYQEKRGELEKWRKDKKVGDSDARTRPTARRPRAAKSADDGSDKSENNKEEVRAQIRARSSSETSYRSATHISRLRIRPLVNVESEQLKAIVRQGRMLRKAEGNKEDDPPVQIFVPEQPPAPDSSALQMAMQIEPRHHLIQHSEYKFEKIIETVPFYLHQPPPVPNPSPETFQDDSSDSRRLDDDLDSGIAVSSQSGGVTRLRHQQLLEKKSVFEIAYNGASPTHLRSDSNSSTPPT